MDRQEKDVRGDPSRYLVGASLTLADVTAASLLAPLVAPEGSPYWGTGGSPVMQERRSALRSRVAGKWVTERYAKDRHARAS